MQTQPSNRQPEVGAFPAAARTAREERRQVNTMGLACEPAISRARLCAWREKRKGKKKFLSLYYFHYGRCAEPSVGKKKRKKSTPNKEVIHANEKL